MGVFLGIVLVFGGTAIAQFGACNAVNELLERKTAERHIALNKLMNEERIKHEIELQKALKELDISD